jgi:hypothetical protein
MKLHQLPRCHCARVLTKAHSDPKDLSHGCREGFLVRSKTHFFFEHFRCLGGEQFGCPSLVSASAENVSRSRLLRIEQDC